MPRIFDWYPTCRQCDTKIIPSNKTGLCKKHRKEVEEQRYKGKYKGRYSGKYNQKKRLEKYGITHEEYKSILLSQDFKCAICDKDLVLEKQTAHIDHNHTSGNVRGILCRNCNLGLGKLQDDINMLKSAYQYLVSHGC